MIADALYVGDTSVDRVMLGDVEVWSAATSLPVVTIAPGGSWSSSRDQLRAACVEYGTTYDTVETLPFLLDTSQATNMTAMFSECTALATVPDMDTSSVTNMYQMFYRCPSLTAAPNMDTSQVTDMTNMFRDCSSLTYVPDMDTSQVTFIGNAFRGCSALTDGNVRCIGKHPSVDTFAMIQESGLTREPFYDTAGNPI